MSSKLPIRWPGSLSDQENADTRYPKPEGVGDPDSPNANIVANGQAKIQEITVLGKKEERLELSLNIVMEGNFSEKFMERQTEEALRQFNKTFAYSDGKSYGVDLTLNLVATEGKADIWVKGCWFSAEVSCSVDEAESAYRKAAVRTSACPAPIASRPPS